jgi:hypothetical protein
MKRTKRICSSVPQLFCAFARGKDSTRTRVDHVMPKLDVVIFNLVSNVECAFWFFFFNT